MSPALACLDSADCGLGDAVLPRNVRDRSRIGFYAERLSFREFRAMVLFAPFVAAPFRDCISIIFQSGPNKKMVRVYAWRVVAAVTNDFVVRYSTFKNSIRNAVSALRFAVQPNQTISIFMGMTRPLPTAGCGDFHLRQQPVFDRNLIALFSELVKRSTPPVRDVVSAAKVARDGLLSALSTFRHGKSTKVICLYATCHNHGEVSFAL